MTLIVPATRSRRWFVIMWLIARFAGGRSRVIGSTLSMTKFTHDGTASHPHPRPVYLNPLNGTARRNEMIALIVIGIIMAAWVHGNISGYKEAEQYTDYWYEQYKFWRDYALGPDEPDDEDGDEFPKEEKAIEPVKAMAAGVGR